MEVIFSKSELKPTGSLSNTQLCFANGVCRTKTNEIHGVDYL